MAKPNPFTDHYGVPIHYGEPIWHDFKLDWPIDRIEFRKRGGGTLSMNIEALSDHWHEMKPSEMEKIRDALHAGPFSEQADEALKAHPAKGQPRPGSVSSRNPTMLIGSEHSIFGKLVHVDPVHRVAAFREDNSGTVTELSRDMLMEIMNALLETGAIGRDELRRLWIGTDKPEIIYKEKVVKIEKTPEEAFDAITDQIKRQPDRAGFWLTKITNEITAIVRERDEE